MSNKWESQKTLFEQREEQHSVNLNKASNSGSFIGFLILLVIGVIFIVGIIEWVHSYSFNFFSHIKFTQSNALYFAYAGDILFFIVVIIGFGLLVSLSLRLIDIEVNLEHGCRRVAWSAGFSGLVTRKTQFR